MRPGGGGATPGGALARGAGLFAAVLVTYSAGSLLSWQAFGASAGGPAFFPSAGITVAALLLAGRRYWPAIVAAILLGEFVVDRAHGETVGLALVYALANAVEPLIGASLTLVWCRRAPDLRRRGDLLGFLAAAVVAGPLIGGLIGGAIIAVNYGGWFPSAALRWFAGDAVGVLVVAVPMLLWRSQFTFLKRRPIESVAVLAASVMVSIAAFSATAPPAMLTLPVLAWAAFRLDMLGAALSGAVVAFAANIMTAQNRGPFAGVDLPAPDRLALVQAFIAVSLIVALLIAREASGRTEAVTARESERRERLRLQALSGLAQQLSAALTPSDIGQAVVDQVINEAGARAVNLGLISADGATLEWVTMAGYPQSVIDEYAGGVPLAERTVATDTARSGEPTLIRSADEYQNRYSDKALWIRLSGAETVVGWPLKDGTATVGALLLVWSEPQTLNAAQLSYVSAVATMVSQAVVRARTYSDERARAAVLQSAVLPNTPDKTAGMDLCIAYEPADRAQALGGDWYDVMPLPKGRTYLAVGDVVGHGLQSVEDMAQLRSAGRALAHQGLPPAQLLSELNGFTRHASQGKFATMAVTLFDPIASTLSYCTAGHPPVLLRRAATGEVLRLSEGAGPVLGPLQQARYTEGQVAIEEGDIVVLYTDGLVERRGMDIETGIRRAQEIIAGWDPHVAVSEYCGQLHEALAPRPRPDDICVIMVRFTGDRESEGQDGVLDRGRGMRVPRPGARDW